MYISWGETRTLPQGCTIVSWLLLPCLCIPSLLWLATVWICPLGLREGHGGWSLFPTNKERQTWKSFHAQEPQRVLLGFHPGTTRALQSETLWPGFVHQQAQTSSKKLACLSQLPQDPAPLTSRKTPALRHPGPGTHPLQNMAPHTSGPAIATGPHVTQPCPPVDGSLCTRQGLATSETGGQPPLPDHLYQLACHNRSTHVAHIGGTPKAHSSGDQRVVCCWDA